MQDDRDEPRFSELVDDELETPFDEAPAEDASGGGRSKIVLLLAVIVVLAIGGVAYFSMQEPGEPPPAPPPIVATAPKPLPEPAPAPDIPVPAPMPKPAVETGPEAETPPAPPPLALEDSDPPVRASLEAAGSADMYTALLANSDLIQRGTGIIDGLSRGLVLGKILPLPPPSGKFKTLELSGQTVLDPAGYSRYDAHAQMVAELDISQLVGTFHSFRPLLEQGYAQLGYEGADFDNALIRALDEILATPEIHSEIALKKKEAVYLFADSELEALSPLQKQLMRMGPDNIALIKAQARALRSGLLNRYGRNGG